MVKLQEHNMDLFWYLYSQYGFVLIFILTSVVLWNWITIIFSIFHQEQINSGCTDNYIFHSNCFFVSFFSTSHSNRFFIYFFTNTNFAHILFALAFHFEQNYHSEIVHLPGKSTHNIHVNPVLGYSWHVYFHCQTYRCIRSYHQTISVPHLK